MSTIKIDDNNKKLIITPKNNLEKGYYEVSWRAVSADTHAVNGKITFSVK
ncbi:copper resistance protein CopC [Providencia rettgeri]